MLLAILMGFRAQLLYVLKKVFSCRILQDTKVVCPFLENPPSTKVVCPHLSSKTAFPKLGRDPKVGREALASGSRKFFGKHKICCYFLVSLNIHTLVRYKAMVG